MLSVSAASLRDSIRWEEFISDASQADRIRIPVAGLPAQLDPETVFIKSMIFSRYSSGNVHSRGGTVQVQVLDDEDNSIKRNLRVSSRNVMRSAGNERYSRSCESRRSPCSSGVSICPTADLPGGTLPNAPQRSLALPVPMESVERVSDQHITLVGFLGCTYVRGAERQGYNKRHQRQDTPLIHSSPATYYLHSDDSDVGCNCLIYTVEARTAVPRVHGPIPPTCSGWLS